MGKMRFIFGGRPVEVELGEPEVVVEPSSYASGGLFNLGSFQLATPATREVTSPHETLFNALSIDAPTIPQPQEDGSIMMALRLTLDLWTLRGLLAGDAYEIKVGARVVTSIEEGSDPRFIVVTYEDGTTSYHTRNERRDIDIQAKIHFTPTQPTKDKN